MAKKKAAKKSKSAPRKKTAKAKPAARSPRRKAAVKSRTVLYRGPRLPEASKGSGSSEKALSASEVHKFRDILVQKREDLLQLVARKKEEEFVNNEESEIGDEADIATRAVEKEILFELTDSEKQTLDKVEAALRKIEKGVYARCESCQRPVGRLRLSVMPWARYCIQCQSQQEVPPAGVE